VVVDFLHCRPRNPRKSISNTAQISHGGRIRIISELQSWIYTRRERRRCIKRSYASNEARGKRMAKKRMEGGEPTPVKIEHELMARKGAVTIGFPRSPTCTRAANFSGSHVLAHGSPAPVRRETEENRVSLDAASGRKNASRKLV
jgi:hypothetical protein